MEGRPRYPRRARRLLWLALLWPWLAQAAGPDPAPATHPPLDRNARFGLGVGYAVVRFDANVRYHDKVQDQTLYVDLEGNLGLPRSDAIPLVYGAYRFTADDALGFTYFRVRRQVNWLAGDETLGDITLDGTVDFRDQTDFISLYYANTWYEDTRSRIQGFLGINTLDIRYVLTAEGRITAPDGTTRTSRRWDTGVTAPLPLLGLAFWFAFTPKWSISTDISLIFGEYRDVSAGILTTSINSRYRFSEHFGGVLGIAYFDAAVEIEDADTRTEIQYAYEGLFLGIHGIF